MLYLPQGKWSVRFAADGYAPYVTGETDGVGTAKAGDTWYMPVAPVQLDVNINLQRLDAPEVVSASPTSEGVRVVFSQYMRASTLSPNCFSLLINSQPVTLKPGDIQLIDGEENDGALYARELLIVCAPEASDLVSLTVDAAVESYTGKALAKTFVLADAPVQTLPIAAAPRFTPNGGTAEIGSGVTITAANGARIYYTTDGSEPTRGSTLYTGPIALGGDTTIRAVAIEPGKRGSAVSEAVFITAPTWQITVLTDGHGTVRLDKVRAAAGEKVSFTAEPYGGYAPDSATLRPQGTRITGKSFTMPEGEVTLVVKFRDAGSDPKPFEPCTGGEDCPGNVFTDMPAKDNWAHDAIDWAIVNKITEGTSATKFSPKVDCKRGQVVTFLWRAAGEPEPTASSTPFTDVKESSFYYKAVLWAVENKITEGTSATTFSPNAVCTRGKVVTFLWRAEGCPEPKQTSVPFTDLKQTGFYYQAVLWAVENDITAGVSATRFAPGNTCTRAQIVTFLYRDMVK